MVRKDSPPNCSASVTRVNGLRALPRMQDRACEGRLFADRALVLKPALFQERLHRALTSGARILGVSVMRGAGTEFDPLALRADECLLFVLRPAGTRATGEADSKRNEDEQGDNAEPTRRLQLIERQDAWTRRCFGA